MDELRQRLSISRHLASPLPQTPRHRRRHGRETAAARSRLAGWNFSQNSFKRIGVVQIRPAASLRPVSYQLRAKGYDTGTVGAGFSRGEMPLRGTRPAKAGAYDFVNDS